MLWARLSSLTAAAVLHVVGLWGGRVEVGGEWMWVSASICGGCRGEHVVTDARLYLMNHITPH